jgi:hypothetical protein
VPHIAITTQVYPPEIHPTAVMVRELAEHLVDRGWRVTVCAGYPHHPYGVLYQGWQKRPWERRLENGVDVRRSWHLIHPSRAIAARALVYLSQALAAAQEALFSEEVDVVLTYGPPLVGPDLGGIVAFLKRARFVNVIFDLYPDLAIESGKLTSPFAIGASRLAERLQYRLSDTTVVLSEGFKRTLVHRGVPAECIEVVPVWLNTSFNENEPIVHTPEQAIDCFERTKMDALGIGSFWVTKELAAVSKLFSHRPNH